MVNNRTYAMVVEISLSPDPFNSSSNMAMFGILILGPFVFLSGTNPPSFFRWFNKYFASLLFTLGL